MNFENDVVQIALKKLFGEKHFSICGLDQIGKMIGSNPERHPNYKFLNALHCVHYADMTPQVRDELPRRVMECLRPDSLNFEAMALALTREGRDFPPIEDAPISNVSRLPWRQ